MLVHVTLSTQSKPSQVSIHSWSFSAQNKWQECSEQALSTVQRVKHSSSSGYWNTRIYLRGSYKLATVSKSYNVFLDDCNIFWDHITTPWCHRLVYKQRPSVLTPLHHPRQRDKRDKRDKRDTTSCKLLYPPSASMSRDYHVQYVIIISNDKRTMCEKCREIYEFLCGRPQWVISV